MSAKPQPMQPTGPVGDFLREFIERESGETNPIDVRCVWSGIGRAVVTYAYGDDPAELQAASLALTGVDADTVRALELGTDGDAQIARILWGER